MKILWVRTGKLLPLDMGGKIRSYHILRHLAARHNLTFVSYYGGARDLAYESEIVRHLPGTVPIHVASPDDSLLKRAVYYLGYLPTRMPFSVAKFASPIVRRRVAGWLADPQFDIAVCDFLSASPNFPNSPAIPTVLFQHNVESAMWRRQAEGQGVGLKKIVFAIEAAKLSRYERSALDHFHHVIAVSAEDRKLMNGMTQREHTSVVPTGVDVSHYRPAASRDPEQPVVIFVGHMSYEPNIDAVEYFCREIWPLVRQSVPEAEFRIVGRTPHARVLSLASESVKVIGAVPSVVDFYQQAQAVVVPLRMGGGTRLKIYEAMAASKAIVSTTLGAEGLDVAHGRNILLAEDAHSFAASVTQVLLDREARHRIGTAAAALAARYDWPVVARLFEQVLTGVVRSVEQDQRYVTSEVDEAKPLVHVD